MFSVSDIDITSRNYDEFTVIYDLRNKQIVRLDSVAADIWEYFVGNSMCEIQDIVEYICSIYECSVNEVEEDIADFLEDLYEFGIIKVNGEYYDSHHDEDDSNIVSEEDYEGKIIEELQHKNQLYSATFEMTYACNERCVHCYAHYPGVDEGTPIFARLSFMGRSLGRIRIFQNERTS